VTKIRYFSCYFFQNAFILGKHKAELVFEMSNFNTILEFPIIKGFLENSGSKLAKSDVSELLGQIL
jgi:hypothetical protein